MKRTAAWRPAAVPVDRSTTTASTATPVTQIVQRGVEQAATQVQVTAHQAAEAAQRATTASRVAARRATVPLPLAQRRGRLALWVAIAALALFAGLAALVHGHRENPLDLAITRFIQRQRRRWAWFGPFMEGVSLLGFAPWSWLAPIGTSAALRWLNYRLESRFLLGTTSASLLTVGIKRLMARSRPAHPSVSVVARLKDFSFPSGHTIQYTVQLGFGAYLAFTLLRPGRLRRLVLAGCGALITLVGPSRIAMGQHWASDVLAAYSLGSACLIGFIALYRRVKQRQRPAGPDTSLTLPPDVGPALATARSRS